MKGAAIILLAVPFSLIGAVLRNEPLPVRQALSGRPVADLAARVTAALEAGAGLAADVAGLA